MKVYNVKELLELKEPLETPIISDGILFPKTKLIIFGKYKSLKSMLGMHLAFSIAEGHNWIGFKTSNQRVLLIQMEIPQFLFRDRIQQYVSSDNHHPDNLYFISEPYLKLDRGYGLSKLETILQTFQPHVLMLDPMYKQISGNISEPHIAEAYQSNIDMLREKYNLAVIILAHSRQQLFTPQGMPLNMGGDELMGSSNWPNWTDTLIRVVRDDPESDFITLTFEACRNTKKELYPLRLKIDRNDLHWKIIQQDD